MATQRVVEISAGTNRRIGRMVAVLLEFRGLKRADLAAALGLSPQAVSGKIHGNSPWKNSETEIAAAFLEVPIPLLSRDPDAVLAELASQFVNYRSA